MVATATSAETELQPRDLTIGILGGTGAQGRGLARRFSAAGLAVVIGSRDKDRASETAGSLGAGVQGVTNLEVAEIADVVIVAVPWRGHADLLREIAPALAHKVVVDCVNPLGFDKEGPYVLAVEEGSAAQQAAALLPHSRVTAAFHHVSADVLEDPEVACIDMDVMVLGQDRMPRRWWRPSLISSQACVASMPDGCETLDRWRA